MSSEVSHSRPSFQNTALRERAKRVVPGGMTGHLNAALLPAGYPQFFERGQGCHLWDVDGNEYIDFMCSWGPNLLGHHHPEVEEAVRRQHAQGDCLNGPTARFVELAERFVERTAHADWALFQKNGTDATTVCLMVARAATGKRKVLVAEKAYHGADPWCTPIPVGITPEDRAHLIHYTYNDVASLEAAAQQAGNDLAAIVCSAFKHDLRVDQELPTPEFARRARELCDAAGAALIVDEVRAGLRVHAGGSWETVGVRPDLSAWSKSIANGYALAAVTGVEALRDAATRIYTTGSFWQGGVAMAAGLATLEVSQRDDVVSHIARLGQRFRDGIAAQSASHRVTVRQSGPAAMPLILFDDDASLKKGAAFTVETLRHGVYLHPCHNMFFSLAHTERDIDLALQATDSAFAVVASRYGQC
ncbi:aminotransferase class III-fold pyridoxal phosphate-dependent enzyme [Diaphorobacter aerolatus]|uniref:Aminotransferase class III-fold pyridoxal phosphate-dependent enzyme n=1 Tax=Diaphorobacter aerolatus TaxID=1288495 RepID=A0A7H0GMI3_9BURK|nr:aminotransferase class III-fold pyridoxal phosphate-dependent enzyme [Diaphorobacter aerolatus]QNP49499.1 aminotransferase class III-fold pyridoxal phosphate-dependent enzyme [Diaphorobacter aerolatus]